MRRIGLTGGIASGKSTVSEMLRRRGVPVVDADVLAREAVAPGSDALQSIASRWPEVMKDGVLDRKALGAIAFSSPEERRALEGILHPWIRAESQRRIEAHLAAGAPQVVYDAPLLFETGADRAMDAVILVAAPESLQIERLVRRDGMSPTEAKARIDAQMPLADKRTKATFVIENDADLSTLEARFEEVWDRVRQGRKPHGHG